jgi:hypothetical protein
VRPLLCHGAHTFHKSELKESIEGFIFYRRFYFFIYQKVMCGRRRRRRVVERRDAREKRRPLRAQAALTSQLDRQPT